MIFRRAKKPELIENFHDQVAYLEKCKFKDLEHWIERTINNRNPFPMYFVGRDISFDDMIVQIYRSSKNTNFKQRVKLAISEIIYNWSPSLITIEALANFLILIGRLKIGESWNFLVNHASNQYFKGKIADEEDIHKRILRVISGLGVKEKRVIPILERDLYEPNYSAICFRTLYEYNLEYAINYLPLIVNISRRDPPPIILKVLLSNLIEKMNVNYFFERFSDIIERFENVEDREILLENLYELGFDFSPIEHEEKFQLYIPSTPLKLVIVNNNKRFYIPYGGVVIPVAKSSKLYSVVNKIFYLHFINKSKDLKLREARVYSR